jgi:hypothetical protein
MLRLCIMFIANVYDVPYYVMTNLVLINKQHVPCMPNDFLDVFTVHCRIDTYCALREFYGSVSKFKVLTLY